MTATLASTVAPTSAGVLDPTTRPSARPRLFNPTVLRLELTRILRNRRMLIFTMIFPAVLFFFVAGELNGENGMISGLQVNYGAYVMVSLGLYGAIMATTSTGASVSLERASGWSRELRLTPLSPVSYIATKMVTALVTAVLAVAVTFTVALGSGQAVVPDASMWLSCAALIVVGSISFAAFGLFMGYVLPAENTMQFLAPILAILSVFGGVFSGPVDPSTWFGQIAVWTPIYGLGQIVRWPLMVTAAGTHEPMEFTWVLSVVGWTALFVAGAVWRFRRDTARV